jgi:uncharacterized membrane protein YfcA
MFHFPGSGVDTYLWLPSLVAFAVSTLAATGGLSGAFLLLPFQVSVLGFSGPAVTPTNFIFNVVAIPSGVYRYWREKRLVKPLVWAVIIGTLPGVFIGAVLRVKFFLDPRVFKLFVALVLLYLAIRMLLDLLSKSRPADEISSMNNSGQPPEAWEVTDQFFNLKQVGYTFNGRQYRVPTWAIMTLSFIVGIIGGIYGIGGGAIITPFLVTVFRLPVHTTAGASLLGTFVTSVAGVIFFCLIAPFYANAGLSVTPDWLLGTLFGAGGAVGVYLGARLQKRLSARLIKGLLFAALLFISVKYLAEFFG